ncbi:uncharacterized protein C8R40DRAFT_618971 [Lentinula edodes]|uniref:uncharacterized protein n=1 Tax=Lentinula edodes TaxID=5353 RepID=UPI001E8D3B84|nr:uncharacterized protein C8R40DRAFT_618971 [Lentinula edodes]KAH7870956.1 hypothetical protein C8R40DRAFT_618971 [Lentinula edodes]
MPTCHCAHTLLQLVVLLLILQDVFHATAIFRNYTVDDSDSSWIYSPYGAWNIGNDCHGCDAQPNATLAYNHTWHDAAFYAPPNQQTMTDPNVPFTANITFNGTAVYVFCIMLNSATYPIFGASDISFHMDGVPVSTYQNSPTENLDTYTYNVPVFAMPSLKYGTHSLMVQNGVANGTDALILLDYILYTADDGLESITPGPSNIVTTNLPTPSPSSPSPSTSSTSSLSVKNSNARNFMAIEIAVPIRIVLLLGVALFSLWRRHRLRPLEVRRQNLRVQPSYFFPVDHHDGHTQSPRAQKHNPRGWSEGSTFVSARSPREELSTSTTTRIVEIEILPPAYCATIDLLSHDHFFKIRFTDLWQSPAPYANLSLCLKVLK